MATQNPLAAVVSDATAKAEQAATTAALKTAGFDTKDADAIATASKTFGGFGSVLTSLQAGATFIMDGFNLLSPAPIWQKAVVWVFALLIIGAIAYSIYSTVQKKKQEGFARLKEPFQAAPRPPSNPKEMTLLNVQPMSIKQAGYGGPAEGGVFDPEFAIPEALKLGYRAFVLQIDYLDVKKDGFEEPGEPTLVYRGSNDALISKNSGSIEKVASAIASVAYRSDTPNYTTPVILYLHLLRTPSPIRRSEEYLKFLSRIAKQLAPLASSHLGLTPMGIFHRQKQEEVLLNTPLSALDGKTIVLCNADTSLFRAPDSSGKSYPPLEDLDYWTNIRVYLDSTDVKLGVTSTATEAGKAVVVPLERLLTLDNQKADAFALKGKQRFTIGLHVPEKNPTPKEFDRALFELGLNMVPVNAVGKADDTLDDLRAPYEKQSYPLKPPAMRERKA